MSERSSISTNQAWLTVAILLLAAILSFIDRQILGLMVDPIKADLNVSDEAMGLLGGPAFALFYAIAGIPLGWMVDRYHRGRIVAAGVALWSMMTALSGFASTYALLFLARMGVGVGEASLGPASHSLMTDIFDKRLLPLAMGIYAAGVSAGAGLAFIFGGTIISWVQTADIAATIGVAMQPWQMVFVIVGLPGLVIALVVLTCVRDPRGAVPKAARPSLLEGLGPFFRAQSTVIVAYVLGISLLTAISYAYLMWLPAFFYRVHEWSPAQVGPVIGLMIIAFGAGGAIGGGALAGQLIKRGLVNAPVVLMAVGAFAAAVPMYFATQVESAQIALILLAVNFVLGTIYVGLGPSGVQMITPPGLRGRVAALYLMLTSLIGMVIGPLGVGTLTTRVFGDDAAVGQSLAYASVGLTLAAGLCFLLCIRPFKTAVMAAETPAETATTSQRENSAGQPAGS